MDERLSAFEAISLIADGKSKTYEKRHELFRCSLGTWGMFWFCGNQSHDSRTSHFDALADVIQAKAGEKRSSHPSIERIAFWQILLRMRRHLKRRYTYDELADVLQQDIKHDSETEHRLLEAQKYMERAIFSGSISAYGLGRQYGDRTKLPNCHTRIPPEFFAGTQNRNRLCFDGWATLDPGRSTLRERRADETQSWYDVSFHRDEIVRLIEGKAQANQAAIAPVEATPVSHFVPVPNRRGPQSKKRNAVVQQMLVDYAGRADELASEKQEFLRTRFRVSRDTATKARKEALEQLQQNPNKTSTNNK